VQSRVPKRGASEPWLAGSVEHRAAVMQAGPTNSSKPTGRVPIEEGVELEVADSGEGPPVLLLHGFPDSLAMWTGVTNQLVAAGHRVIAYDHRGFGASGAPTGRRHYAIDRIVQDAVEVLGALGVREPVTVVGHDWGAFVSWALCLSRPELVGRHVAISAGHPRALRSVGLEQIRKAFFVPGLLLVGIAEQVLSARDFAVWRRLVATHPDLDRVTADISRTGRLTAALNWYRANAVTITTRRWDACRVPTRGIFSTGDAHLVEQQMVRSELFMDAPWDYVPIHGAGHWVPIEQPQRLAAVIASWATSP
jgi:pimeloyl-ACP methyl ester carboxylesterase